MKNGVRESLPRLRLSGEGGRGRDIAGRERERESVCGGRCDWRHHVNLPLFSLAVVNLVFRHYDRQSL